MMDRKVKALRLSAGGNYRRPRGASKSTSRGATGKISKTFRVSTAKKS